MRLKDVSIVFALVYPSFYATCIPAELKTIESMPSTVTQDAKALANSNILTDGTEAHGNMNVDNSHSMQQSEIGCEQKLTVDTEKTRFASSKPEAREQDRSAWNVFDVIRKQYEYVKKISRKVVENLHQCFQFLANRVKTPFKPETTKPEVFRGEIKDFKLQYGLSKEPNYQAFVLRNTVAKLCVGIDDRSPAEFRAWAEVFTEIMKLKEFKLQHLELESEMEHALNDLVETEARTGWKTKFSNKRKPLIDFRKQLQVRRRKFMTEGYYSRAKYEIKTAPWASEILWPQGKLLDAPGKNSLDSWFCVTNFISDEHRILKSLQAEYSIEIFKESMNKLKNKASKTNSEATSKEKTAATTLIAYVYESSQNPGKGLKVSPEGAVFTKNMMEDLSRNTIPMLRPNLQRIRIELGKEPNYAPSERLKRMPCLVLSRKSKKGLDNFKELFEQAVKDDSGTKVDNQVKVLRESLEALRQNPTKRDPAEFKAWATIYAHIMKEFKTKNGRSQYLQHLKVEAVMQYGLLNLQVLAKTLAPVGQEYLACMQPLVILQERLFKRLQFNGTNGWITRFMPELDDTPWDMEILYPERKLLDYLGKEKLEKWFQLDPLIADKFLFLSSARHIKAFSAFKTQISQLEEMARDYNRETTAEQKTAAIALLSFAYESLADPTQGIDLSSEEAPFLEGRFLFYATEVEPQLFAANNNRLSQELLRVKLRENLER
ncbi:hypothetical protein O181_031441 [Austropuccinia psidii MF-1]|uniref:Uncharacterized protein n=1 Tax=Austropuccinia psidii MF-1 TaxID=1389203 RepID=A0A9Q3H572_9BASI|nr:hypothetical protein [Austropuccinia psidii MF-1]